MTETNDVDNTRKDFRAMFFGTKDKFRQAIWYHPTDENEDFPIVLKTVPDRWIKQVTEEKQNGTIDNIEYEMRLLFKIAHCPVAKTGKLEKDEDPWQVDSDGDLVVGEQLFDPKDRRELKSDKWAVDGALGLIKRACTDLIQESVDRLGNSTPPETSTD